MLAKFVLGMLVAMSVGTALQLEKQNSLPLTAFYNTPQSLQGTHAGDLLKQEIVKQYTLPPGASAVRILYHSKDAADTDVVSSAAILIPAGKTPPNGWPIVIFAHGTSGVARQCAPSAMKDVYYGSLGLFDYVKAGLAVVAVDYHGLGTEGSHQYINKVAQANDVIYAVPAARSAVTSLGSKWVVAGHSQGGLAAWGVAEREAALKDDGYLGAVPIAAATLHDGWLVAHPDTTHDAGFYLAWLAYGIHARFPQFEPTEMLSKVGQSHYDAIARSGCWLYAFTLYRGIDAPAMLKPAWSENPWVQKFFAANRVEARSVAGPVFAIAGEGDTAVPIGAVREVIQRACSHRQNVYFRSYPGLEHDEAMRRTLADQIKWIKARFAGEPAQSNCS